MSGTGTVRDLSLVQTRLLSRWLTDASSLVCPPASDPEDPSIPVLRTACLGLLSTVHSTLHTSHDFGLFHPFMVYAWHLAARTLLRLLQASLSRGEYEEVTSLLADVDLLRTAMRRVGDRLPIGYRQDSMIKALLDEVMQSGLKGEQGGKTVMVSVFQGVTVPLRLKAGGAEVGGPVEGDARELPSWLRS